MGVCTINIGAKVSTGMEGLDFIIDGLRLGDNVVWQIENISVYKKMVELYVEQALVDKRKIIYIRFGNHEPLIENNSEVSIYYLDAEKGFENFATSIYEIIESNGKKVFYVFDCLTGLLESWHSDLMIGNFFKVTCPHLYDLDTIAYFSIIRNAHTYSTIAGIRETTQLLLDLYEVNSRMYVHPLKVWKRYSSSMFFPHLIQGQKAICITGSSETAELFSAINRGGEIIDYWDAIFLNAKKDLGKSLESQLETKGLLMSMLFGCENIMYELCSKYFTLKDILRIASREVGTGFIGGKSVGMLLARKILETENDTYFSNYLEPHDSYYLGADIFYTYIVQNGWWELRARQKNKDGYFKYAPELKEKLLSGKFPENIQQKFIQMLEYFGQSPIIVRSSSLLEDNFGNAFAGKYESIFCVNQGTPEKRYEAFEQAVRIVYASTMNEDALAYRLNRGLMGKDEQMAILVQRVSGDYYKDYFFPHAAGVGNSSNLYVWDKSIDMEAGMLRMVFGLGTRAVDRTVGDYAKIIALDNPLREPLVNQEDKILFSQRYVDVLSIKDNSIITKNLYEIMEAEISIDKSLFVTLDYNEANRLRELGYKNNRIPYILDFNKMFRNTNFPVLMRKMLDLLSDAYNYPVDIEFTVNFVKDESYKINLLQCRPLQTKGLGNVVQLPEIKDKEDCILLVDANFMGGNVRIPLGYVIIVSGREYKALSEQDKYEIARQIGLINQKLKDESVMLIGPGRWGTTTPSLGVPVNFSELSNMSIICEVSSAEDDFMPELSYGSHFFQDVVETGIFYVAIFADQKNVVYNPEKLLSRNNLLKDILPKDRDFSNVIHIAKTDKLVLCSDILSQRVMAVELD